MSGPDAPIAGVSAASRNAYRAGPEKAVSEQVPADALPSAVALNSISYNIARSFGPAIGGVIVAAAGAIAAFAANALFYLPLIIVLYLWRRVQETLAPSA